MLMGDNQQLSTKTDKVTELFPYEMPFRAARVIAGALLLLASIIGLSAGLIDYPETISAPFVLLPESGADPVQSPFDGIVTEVRANTGSSVSKGDILYVLRSPRIQELATSLRAMEKDLAAIARQKIAVENTFQINRKIQEAEIIQHEKEADFRRQYLDVYHDVKGRMERLAKEGLASSLEMLNHQLGYAAAERDVALADEASRMAKLTLDRLDAEHRQELERLDNDFARLSVGREGLVGQLSEVQGDLACLSAPCDGTVVSVERKRVGDVVSVGQELCQIAPNGAPPMAHLQLEERGMARLREGQPVKLLFEAFPYQRYGVVDGSLTWLSPAAIVTSGEGHFIAHVKPEQLEIGAGESRQPLRAGMGGEARIQVGRRTLIEYVFEPIRQLRENMRSQPVEAVDKPSDGEDSSWLKKFRAWVNA